MRWRSGALWVLAVVLVSCSPSASPTPSSGASSLTIYAAASLKGALERVKSAYEAGNPGVALTISTDSSAALEIKIEQGAAADLFLSADTANPQKVVDKGLAAGSLVKFAGNLLTVIVPTANPAGIRRPLDLARRGVKVIAAADSVPISNYASRLVANLSKVSDYPADFAARYSSNIASKEDNVAAVVSKIELGEGDAAIVYATDAKASKRVTSISVPESVNVPATYAGVVIRASHQALAAQAFLDWLEGRGGQAILASLGFLRVR